MSMLSSLLEEMTTGTGAAFRTGQGEQIASPFAFGKKKKPRRVTIKKAMFEDSVSVSLTPEELEKRYEKWLKEFPRYRDSVGKYINSFESYSMGDVMDNIPKAEQFAQIGDKLYNEIYKIYNQLEDVADQLDEAGDNPGYHKAMDLHTNYYKLGESAYKIQDGMEDIIKIMQKFKESQD